jgi:hypothetical protein
MNIPLADELAALGRLTTNELCARYAELHGRAARTRRRHPCPARPVPQNVRRVGDDESGRRRTTEGGDGQDAEGCSAAGKARP